MTPPAKLDGRKVGRATRKPIRFPVVQRSVAESTRAHSLSFQKTLCPWVRVVHWHPSEAGDQLIGRHKKILHGRWIQTPLPFWVLQPSLA